MDVTPIEVKHYVTAAGKVPFEEWVDALEDKKTQYIFDERITRIASGLLGDHKWVALGVYEIRIHHGSGLRIYFGRIGQTIILLLCAGDKKQSKPRYSSSPKLLAGSHKEDTQ